MEFRMKNSRFCIVCAGFLLCALVGKFVASVAVNGVWVIYPGWAIRLVADVAAIWVAIRSQVKYKSVGLLIGSVLYAAVVVILALLDSASVVQIYKF